MHAEAYAFIRDCVVKLPKLSLVIEFGSKNINGSARCLLPADVPYIGVDRVPGPDVDVVADGASYQPPSKADLVICAEALEHAENAADLVLNAVACVAPGGHLIITCATDHRVPHSGHDGGAVRDGEYYQNVKLSDLESWLSMASAEVVERQVYATRGDLYVLAKVDE